MSELVPANFGQVSTIFQNTPIQDDLSSGIQASFGLIGYKGKVWSIRYRGDEQQLMRDDGDGPRNSIEVVLLAASTHVSKVWYEHGYVEGSTAAPDCFSNNGIQPDPASTKKQCDTCATCPMNAWGSRITPAGKSGKACSDSKRIAVVPEGDIGNEAFGGPMLLRVPAASLQDLAAYGQKMQHLGYPYYAVATRVRFDPQEAYPKFQFNAIRPLTDDEAKIVLTHRDGHAVQRILSENEFATPAAPAAETVAGAFEQAPVTQQTATPAPTPVQPAAQTATSQGNTTQKVGGFGAVAPVKAEPAAQTATQQVEPQESDEDRELREMEERMAAIKAKKAAQAKAEGAKAKKSEPAKPVTPQDTAPASIQENATTASNSGPTATTAASPSEAAPDEAPLNDQFIKNIDAELDALLGTG